MQKIMKMGCRENIEKYVLVIANLVFALSGLALLGIGVFMKLNGTVLTSIIEVGWYEFSPIAAMAVGSIVFFVAFLGCCGAIKKSNGVLVTYSIIMILLLVLTVALATIVFIDIGSLGATVMKELYYDFINYQPQFHEIEAELMCCGLDGAESYGWNSSSLPPSCCPEDVVRCSIVQSYPGCNFRVLDFITTVSTGISAICIVAAALELVLVVFGLCLAKHVRNNERISKISQY
ncbi:leukocyte surface antigen CD53-like [Leguminivora glycinivorella]|uniref:leukocyte surface antigen CD53-like n=1 Tax=Leguminivora glycinivorella TaxID=1035111 RepID=UPI00200D3D84|nr:leukocyte surface antigen CD53-like [Leguminivora glycinivorella]